MLLSSVSEFSLSFMPKRDKCSNHSVSSFQIHGFTCLTIKHGVMGNRALTSSAPPLSWIRFSKIKIKRNEHFLELDMVISAP